MLLFLPRLGVLSCTFVRRYSGVAKLTNGMELNAKVKEFVKNTDLGSSYTYTTVGGKVVVDNVTSESITLRYDDFKFTKNGGEYTIKGRVLYHKN